MTQRSARLPARCGDLAIAAADMWSLSVATNTPNQRGDPGRGHHPGRERADKHVAGQDGCWDVGSAWLWSFSQPVFRDGLRRELDPYRWIERSTLPGHDPDAVPLAMPVRSEIVIEVTTDMDEELARLKREQRVERAMNIYLSTPRGQGLGHSALMALGRRLSNAGLNFGEVRYQMEEAIHARPCENARAEIAAVIKTLIRTPSLRAG